MTNKEKYLDEILALHLLQAYSTSELNSEFGIECKEDRLIEYGDVMKWLQAEYEEPKEEKIEYIGVTNDIPRFTEIEVRDSIEAEWVAMKFICVIRNKTNYPYVTLSDDGLDTELWKYARIRKDWRERQ